MTQRRYQPRTPIGAEFHRCALQVNPASYATFRGQKPTRDPTSHASAMVARAEEIGISVLAITNHNNADDVDLFRKAADGRRVVIFPGFEISSSEGVHLLCIYSPETSLEQLRHFLGDLGIRQAAQSSDLSPHTVKDLLAKVKDQGGISIAAHVTSDNGLLGRLRGQTRINAWCDPNLLAVQIPAAIHNLPDGLKTIVRGRDPAYGLRRTAGKSLAVAVVNANDVVAPDDLMRVGATVQIKMSAPSIEGFRQAFLDPESRILLNSDVPPPEHPELLSIRWTGGFLDGTVIPFHRNLNVVIGGRGAGKSTIVESIRYVLGMGPVGEAASAAHSSIVKQVLRPGTKIALELRVHHPTTTDYRIERTVPNPPIVRNSQGGVSKLIPSNIVPDVEVYGQHEISEIAASQDKRIQLLDRFVPKKPATNERKTQLQRALEKARQYLLAEQHDLDAIETELASLPGLEETLGRYQEVQLDAKLKEQSLFLREERIFSVVEERLEPFRKLLEDLGSEIPIDRAFLSAQSLSDLPSNVLLDEVNQPLRQLDKHLEGLVKEFGRALESVEMAVDNIRQNWTIRKEAAQTKYEAILRDLEKTAVAAEEYIEIKRKIERLAPLREKKKLLRRRHEEHLEQRQSLCAEWEDLKAEELRMLHEAADRVNKQLHNQVEVRVVAAGDRSSLTKLLREKIGGRLKETLETLENIGSFSLPEFVESCRRGENELRRRYGVPPAQARQLADASGELLMQIEELTLRPKLAIRLNTARHGVPPSWQDLDELSKGQKATAVLLLLMLKPDAPLVIDQPEDDLDNRFVTEGIVPMIRDAKPRRQFVMATHNANIPVLGDAELIVGLTAGEAAARIDPKDIGSIDDRAVRELVEEVLEGGKDAFETRRMKYGY